jgi:hypothetical protein
VLPISNVMPLECGSSMCEREFEQSSQTVLAFLGQLHDIGRNTTNFVNKHNNMKNTFHTSRLNQTGLESDLRHSCGVRISSFLSLGGVVPGESGLFL